MEKKVFDFVGKRNLWFLLSTMIIVISFSVTAYRMVVYKQGFNFGIDFTGGSELVLRFDKLSEIGRMPQAAQKNEAKQKFLIEARSVLKKFNLAESTLQFSEGRDIKSEDLLIKTRPLDNDTRQSLLKAFETEFGKMELLESDIVGPSIGSQLATTSLKIVGIALVMLLIYITFRFEFASSVAAIVALIHDALITIGLAGMFRFEIDVAFVAAILTILGYSNHDTIVIFDRIRENIPLIKNKDFTALANISIRQTIARSINTIMAVELTLASMLVFGGETIKTFCIVMLIGIFFGGYSSIFIATPVLVMIKKWQEGAEQ